MALTTTGIILWSLAIGLLIFGLLGKIGNHKTDENHAFDALTTDRPYRKALEKETALHIMSEDAGKHFDPNLISLFHSKL